MYFFLLLHNLAKAVGFHHHHHHHDLTPTDTTTTTTTLFFLLFYTRVGGCWAMEPPLHLYCQCYIINTEICKCMGNLKQNQMKRNSEWGRSWWKRESKAFNSRMGGAYRRVVGGMGQKTGEEEDVAGGVGGKGREPLWPEHVANLVLIFSSSYFSPLSLFHFCLFFLLAFTFLTYPFFSYSSVVYLRPPLHSPTPSLFFTVSIPCVYLSI